MGQSSSLRLSDLRAIHRLVDECRELWADPAAWRQHLVAGASRLTGTKVAQYTEVAKSSQAGPPTYLCSVAVGFPQDSDWLVYQAARTAYPNKFDFFIGSKRMLGRLAAGKHAAGLREELCPDQRWYRSAVYNEYRRPVHSDGNVISIVNRGSGTYSVLDVNQCFDDPRPTLRTKLQLAYLHRMFDPLVGTELVTESQRGLAGLTPQLRATLERLLAGETEKKIAAQLGVRPATVHEYVGKIYRHFGVHSRAELMAYFIRRRPRPR
jgi:DNA-binding CsgD family transcriptional regulator